jgi:multiple sugar transport system substrate-binding protein
MSAGDSNARERPRTPTASLRTNEEETRMGTRDKLRRNWRLYAKVASAVAMAAMTVAGCGGGDSDQGSKPAASGKKVDMAAELKKPAKLTYWAWTPKLDEKVKLFEKKYPNIDVKLVNAGQGPPAYAKLRTALKAKSGAPDVAQVEFSHIPTFTITNDLLDLTPYGANDVAGQFEEWTWKQVAKDGKIYAIPADTGPMGMLYRKDIFDKNGIEVPKTWEEFATASRALHKKDPEVFMTNLANNDIGSLLGLMWQAGSRPFSVESTEKIGLNVADDGAKRWADLWTPLIKEGVISTDAGFNNAWFRGLSNGKYATWLAAAWGPGYLQGTAAKTSGKWRAAPLPQWSDGEQVSGAWGGSTAAVIASTKAPAAAAEFAKFINTDPEAVDVGVKKSFLFPPQKDYLASPEFTEAKLKFYGGQQVNKLFAEISKTVPKDFEWNPFEDFVASKANETLGSAMTKKQDLNKGLQAWQEAVSTYAKQQGFEVK